MCVVCGVICGSAESLDLTAAEIHWGGVFVSQVINCARALKAVHFRAINYDKPLKHIR